MSVSITDLAYQACRDLGCLRPGTKSVQSQDVLNDIRDSANQIIDADRIDNYMAYAYPAAIYPLQTLLEQYQIGPGQSPPNFNAQRPTGIAAANVIINVNSPISVRKQLAIWSVEEWAQIRVRAVTPGSSAPVGAIPDGMYFDNNFDAAAGYATINLWPAPQYNPQQLELFTNQTLPFLAFADLTTQYLLPPGYERYLRKAIADEIAPMMTMYWKAHRLEGMQAVSEAMWAKVHEQAIEARAAILSDNAPDAVKYCDPQWRASGQRGAWNFATGSNDGRSG